jgi:hypothetical protein
MSAFGTHPVTIRFYRGGVKDMTNTRTYHEAIQWGVDNPDARITKIITPTSIMDENEVKQAIAAMRPPTGIPEGGFRLHWEIEGEEPNESADFLCLDDALTHAAILYARDDIEAFTRLENWLGEDACPADQLLPIAQMRTRAALQAHDREKDQAAMEALAIF